MPSEIIVPLGLALVAAVLYYLAVPLLIFHQQRYPARPEVLPVGGDDLDPKVWRFLTERSEEVLRLGFAEPTLVRFVNAAPNVDIYLVLLANRDRGDLALVTCIADTGADAIRTSYVEFSTRFESGHVFNTLNTEVLNAFRPPPLATRTQSPSVRDPGDLYRLHRFVVGRDGPGGPTISYDRERAIEDLIEQGFIQPYDGEVSRGLLSYRPNEGVYRPTLLGAYTYTWGQLPPLRWVRQLLLTVRERAVLRELRRASHEAEG